MQLGKLHQWSSRQGNERIRRRRGSASAGSWAVYVTSWIRIQIVNESMPGAGGIVYGSPAAAGEIVDGG